MPRSMARLPGNGRCVFVGPPLSASGPRSMSFTPRKPQVLSSVRLKLPPIVPEQFPPAPPCARMVFVAVKVPAFLTLLPPLAGGRITTEGYVHQRNRAKLTVIDSATLLGC